MGESFTLDVDKRDTIGKKVNSLRREGIVPGVVYGPLSPEPVAVQVEWAKLRPVLSKAGGTSLIDLNINGETVSVLVRTVQRHPIRQNVIHIDFYAVDVNVTTHATVPIYVPDTEAAGKRLQARIFQPLNRIEIECLPADIPHRIEVDLSILESLGQTLTVADLPAIKGVKYLTDDDVVVVRTVSLAAIAAAEAAEAEEALLEEAGEEIGEVEVIGRGKDEDDFDKDED